MMTNEKKQTILIVEDEHALLKVYAHRFGEEGVLVLQATNGQEGLDLAIKEKLDIILFDILMPVMDGLTMMKKLRARGSWGREVPIILLTNLPADVEKVNNIIAQNRPVYYLIKLDWSLNDIVKKAKSAMLAQ